MRSYFCEEEIFPNDLSRVNKVSNSWELIGFILMNKGQPHDIKLSYYIIDSTV